MILLIDNYDSFTFNLVHFLGELGARCEVRRNDSISVDEALALRPEAIVLSPGPCTPNEAGVCLDLIRGAAGAVPILGVCLGHQAIGQAFGGAVVRADRPMHGKTSAMHHNGGDVFAGLPAPFEATRYHSLVVERDTLPDALAVTAWTEDGTIMGLRHRALPVFGVQFHPESIASRHGHDILRNFLALARGTNPLVQRAARDPGTEPGLKPVLARVAQGEALREDEAEAAFETIMEGEATTAQVAALLMAMRVRGETAAELTGAMRALRGRMLAVDAPPGAIDGCGTGGDAGNTPAGGTLNVSTAVTFVLAGAGVPVAKHGNRALSSRSGASDVLAALGVATDVPAARLSAILRRAGCAFLFAPNHHPALRHAAAARVELGTRSLFNLLGPLANPARVRRQLIGVFDPRWGVTMAEALRRTGTQRAWIVHGQGLDELTVAGENQVAELDDGAVRQFTVVPEDAGLPRAPVAAIRGGDAAFNAAALEALLDGAPGAYRDTVVLNAAAALVVAGRADTLPQGAALAVHSIDGGDARAALDALRRETAAALLPA